MDAISPIDWGETVSEMPTAAGEGQVWESRLPESLTDPGKLSNQLYCQGRIVKNSSGALLLRRTMVTYEAGYYGRRVDAYAATASADFAGVVDPWVASAGVPIGHYFRLITNGFAWVNKVVTGAASNLTQGAPLASTSASSGSGPTAGFAELYSASSTWGAAMGNQLIRAAKIVTATAAASTTTEALVELNMAS